MEAFNFGRTDEACLKYRFSRWGLYPILDENSCIPNEIRSAAGGCSGIAPPKFKRRVLSAYFHRFGLRHFLETGTFVGDTLAHIAKDERVFCNSIWLSQEYYSRAVERFDSWKNVEIHNGDSAEILPEVMSNINEPALIWLGGHYSGESAAKSVKDTPIIKDVKCLIGSMSYPHVILIGDARCFDDTNGYPYLER